MNDWHAEIFRYDLALLKPLTSLREHNGDRSGLVLRVKDRDDLIVCSEISPLPGLHDESLEDACAQLIEFVSNRCQKSELFPSVRMGVDLIEAQLCATKKGQALFQYLNPKARHTLRLRALIDPENEDAIRVASSYVMQGYKTIKLKVGRLPLSEEVRIVKEVRQAVGRSTEICLDANRAFDLAAAIEFGSACARQQISCIEEPVKNPQDIAAFFRATQIPVCLDETLHEKNLLDDVDFDILADSVAIFVIKPSLLGSLERLQDTINRMRVRQVKLVINSAFESGLGLSLNAQLAAIDDENDMAHGLGTFSWFKEDLLTPPFRPFRGQIDLARIASGVKQFNPEANTHCRLVWAH